MAINEYIRQDFFRSARAHASEKVEYEFINRDETPHRSSDVVITLPDNVLVLGKNWNEYVQYWVDHNKQVDICFIRRWMGVQSRGGEAEFKFIAVKRLDPTRKWYDNLLRPLRKFWRAIPKVIVTT